MKWVLVVVGLLVFGVAGSPSQPGVSFEVFYSSLGSHGEWISCDAGVYAWRPAGVAVDWRPYYQGQWCWTDDGWYWTSDEPWAWATYHYGRWYCDDSYGWVWIPGYDWAPAWVEWRYGGGCVGWAPLSPYAVFDMSFGIHYGSYWITPYFWWSFVDCRHIGNPYVNHYVYGSEYNTRYIGRTRSAGSVRQSGGRVVTRGPDRDYVEQRGNIHLEKTEIRDVADHPVDRLVRDGGRERVEVYRPKIDDREDRNASVRPDRVYQADRRISLDTRGIDVRARNVDREADREMWRTDKLRKRNNAQIQRGVPHADDSRTLGGSKPEVRRGREYARRNDSPSNDRERRKEGQREFRRDGQREQLFEKLWTPPRRDDSRSVSPERKASRSEEPRIDHAPAPRPGPKSGGSGGDPGSRGGGRR
jgi:hypothetical protein